MLKIKTIGRDVYLNHPPNGGWGWVVMVASFFILGNAFGISKSLGIYFLDIKYEFDVTNSATSWISSLFLGAIGMAGLFASVISLWMDARNLIIFGGLLAAAGLLLSAFSSSLQLIYLGCFLAGTGHGIAFISATSQVSLYFSTLRPLATGVMLSGSSVCSTVLPYLNNYFLGIYGWRDSFWILSAMSLNTCVLGALIRPIENVSTTKDGKARLQIVSTPEQDTKNIQPCQRLQIFLSMYWAALCLLMSSSILDLGLFVPNVFLVPLARSLGFTRSEGTMLLSFISIGDIICRPLNGALITRFKRLHSNLLFYVGLLILIMSFNQLLAVFAANFAVLTIYTLMHGCLYGLTSTAVITAVPNLMGTDNIDHIYGVFFSVGSFSLLASAPFAGIFVDIFQLYSAAYWYCIICFGVAGLLSLVMHFIVKIRGGVVFKHKTCTAILESKTIAEAQSLPGI